MTKGVDDDEATSPPPSRPTIVVETVDEDGSSGTGEEFSLASEDEFTREND